MIIPNDRDYDLEQFRARMLRETEERLHALAPQVAADAKAWQQERQQHRPAGTPKQQEEGSKAILTRLSDVTTSSVRWLWRDRIPRGKLTVVDGDPGLGKSLLTLDIAARVSAARSMPDGTRSDFAEPAGVVLLTAEDDPADTIRPRLEVAGADCSQVVALSAVRDSSGDRLPTLLDLEELREVITTTNARMVVVDPLMAFLPGIVNSFRDQDIRRALAPLAALAMETEAAIVIVRHLNKSSGGSALYRGGGSIGIIGAARSGLLVARDPDDEERRILAVTKSNLAKIPSALAYRVVANTNDVPSLVWEGVSQHTATSLLAAQIDGEDRSALDEAKEFLRETLADGPREAKDVQREARNAAISDATLRRAKTSLGVLVRKEGNFLSTSQRWTWSLPVTEGAQDPPEGAQIRAHEHLQANAEKNSRKDANFSEGAQGSVNEHLQSYEEEL